MKKRSSTTAEILAALDQVVSELARIENALAEVPVGTVEPDDASRIKRAAVQMRQEAQRLIDCLSEARLEERKN